MLSAAPEFNDASLQVEDASARALPISSTGADRMAAFFLSAEVAMDF